MKRREFLIGSTATVVAAGVAPSLLHAATPESTFSGAPKLSRERFEQLVNSNFRIYKKGWVSETVKLEKLKEGPLSPGAEQFTLEFRGSQGTRLPSGMYLVNHRQDGDMLLYLESVGTSKDSYNYLAVFNLIA